MDQSIRLRRPDEKPQEERPALNVVFAAASADAIACDTGNRRFVAIAAETSTDVDSSRCALNVAPETR